MAATVTCPRCHAGIPKDGIIPGQAVVCGNCGATLRFRSRSATAKPAAPTPAEAHAPVDSVPSPAVAAPTRVDEGYDLAPEPVAPPPRLAPGRAMENALAPAPPDRPRKASPRKRAVKRADRKPLVVGGAVGLVALVCVVGAAVRWLGGTRQAPAGVQAQAQARADPAGAQAQPDPVARGYSF